MILIRAKNRNGELIIDTFIEVLPIHARCIEKVTSFGEVNICVLDEDRISKSNKVFNTFTATLINVLETTFGVIDKNAKIIADDYLHNITKIHGNQKSIIERLTMSAEQSDTYNGFKNQVKETIVGTPDDVVEDICALAKEVRLIDYHIGGYKLLTNINPPQITFNHNLKKFLLGLSHLFFDSFKEANILISLHEINPDFKCSFEYETFNIAMHAFIENITKYAKPYSKVIVYTNEDSNSLIFEMESIRIEREEKFKIFERGFSGRCVPKEMKGSGIGMYLLKQSLERSGIEFNFIPDYSHSSEVNDIRYDKNKFIFYFPSNSEDDSLEKWKPLLKTSIRTSKP